jgi:hypothetical protein
LVGLEPASPGIDLADPSEDCANPDDPGAIPKERRDQVVAQTGGISRIVAEVLEGPVVREEDTDSVKVSDPDGSGLVTQDPINRAGSKARRIVHAMVEVDKSLGSGKQTIEAASVGSNPQGAAPILVEHGDPRIGKTIGIGRIGSIVSQGAPFRIEAIEPIPSPNPEGSLIIFEESSHEVAGKAIRGIRCLGIVGETLDRFTRIGLKGPEPILGSNPERPTPILQNGTDGAANEEMVKDAGGMLEAIQAGARADPQISIAITVEGGDIRR